jgi:hypothetical protein
MVMVSFLCGMLPVRVVGREIDLERNMRTTQTKIAFARPFRFLGIDETFGAGTYKVETDEEAIEIGGHTAYRRVRTLLIVETSGRVRTVDVRPHELDRAIEESGTIIQNG